MDFLNGNFLKISEFVSQIRQIYSDNEPNFNEALKGFLTKKSSDEIFKMEFTNFCFLVSGEAFFVNAFTDYGINSDRGFFTEIIGRIKHKILPENIPDNELRNFIKPVFSKRHDFVWLEKINDSNWEGIFKLMDKSLSTESSEKMAQQIYNAIIILCHRLTAIGLDSYLVSKLPEIDNTNSPFFELNHQVTSFVKKHLNDKTLEIDKEELQVIFNSIYTINQLFTQIQLKKEDMGTSLHLTFIIRRAQQQVNRIKILLNLIIAKEHDKALTLSQLIVDLIKAEQTKNNITKFFKENTILVASRVISHTSEKGEHYIGFSKKENVTLFKSAMGGGLVVVFLVYFKHFIHDLHLSLFFEGFLFGLNYGLGFVFMHLVHFTLATKQPAMTASYIAENIGSGKDETDKPWTVFKQIIRSQFISLIGNLVIVLPLCFLSAWLIKYYFNYSVFNFTEAKAQLFSNHPMYSASLIYACITGVFLSLSGIVIGYIDNKVVYSQMPERIIKHPQLKKYSLKKRQKIAKFMERNLGAITGNLFLGFSLGMAGNIGKFIGIPFDIRHITISSGNFAITIGSHNSYKLDLILNVLSGVILIGLINIASSFLISFALACSAKGLSLKQSLKILVGYKN